MRIIVAPDSFKDALPSHEAARALASGLRQAQPDWEITEKPLADGGEGTARVMCINLRGEWRVVSTVDALLRGTSAGYAWVAEEKLAVVELAEPTGLEQLSRKERNPMNTSSYGAGVLIRKAVEAGAKTVYLALGGSSSHDLGMGMAAAMGFTFLAGKEVIAQPKGEDLLRCTAIIPPANLKQLRSVRFFALCDVANPLLGKTGAAQVYAPQKGATPAMVKQLEEATARVAPWLSELAQRDVTLVPGAGAAGGCGAGALAFFNATLQSGTQKMLELTRIHEALNTADWLITGEGSLDGQTLSGKLISGVANIAHQHGVATIAVCGRTLLTIDQQKKMGITAVVPIGNGKRNHDAALSETRIDLERTGYQLARIIGATTKIATSAKGSLVSYEGAPQFPRP